MRSDERDRCARRVRAGIRATESPFLSFVIIDVRGKHLPARSLTYLSPYRRNRRREEAIPVTSIFLLLGHA